MMIRVNLRVNQCMIVRHYIQQVATLYPHRFLVDAFASHHSLGIRS